jgi:hypothetical protein
MTAISQGRRHYLVPKGFDKPFTYFLCGVLIGLVVVGFLSLLL